MQPEDVQLAWCELLHQYIADPDHVEDRCRCWEPSAARHGDDRLCAVLIDSGANPDGSTTYRYEYPTAVDVGFGTIEGFVITGYPDVPEQVRHVTQR